MAWRAINVIAPTPAFENVFGKGKRHGVAGVVADLAGIEITVFMQLSTRDCAFDGRTRGALVDKEITLSQRIDPRLHVHVDSAGR